MTDSPAVSLRNSVQGRAIGAPNPARLPWERLLMRQVVSAKGWVTEPDALLWR
jgi:hypothetical protein